MKTRRESENQANADYERFNKIVVDLKDYENLLFHKEVAKYQRMAYLDNIKNVDLLRTKLMIGSKKLNKITPR